MVTLLSVIVIVSGYLLGSIPVGLLVVRAVTGKDVRDVGSGRIGGTNVLRVAGPWVALLTSLSDVAKGLLAVYLARAVVGTPVVEALAGLAAVSATTTSSSSASRVVPGPRPLLAGPSACGPGMVLS